MSPAVTRAASTRDHQPFSPTQRGLSQTSQTSALPHPLSVGWVFQSSLLLCETDRAVVPKNDP